MAGIFKDIFGGKTPDAPASQSTEDADFADFAEAPDPSPASIATEAFNSVSTAAAFPTSGSSSSSSSSNPLLGSSGRPVVYTKWYRVWERTTPADFYAEGFVLIFLVFLAASHVWGSRKNRRIAHSWFSNYVPALEAEFAVVGFGGGRRAPSIEDVEGEGLAKASVSDRLEEAQLLLKEKTPQEFVSYATGRQNVALVDCSIELSKRYNPALWAAETIMGFVFESAANKGEVFQATLLPFDGKESEVVPVPGGKVGSEIIETRAKGGASSTYDGFIWAVVNKDYMKTFRDERYDVSLTTTRDHTKLPAWATVMTENAEITEQLLTNDLIKAIEQCGDCFRYLLVSDQPMDKPTKFEETRPKKRISLSIKLDDPSSAPSSVPIFSYFLRMTDSLVAHAHFRPEVLRKVRAVRDEEAKKLARVGEDEKAEERSTKRDKEKKEKRDATLKGLSADEQRKFLDREREKELRKSQKKMTRKA